VAGGCILCGSPRPTKILYFIHFSLCKLWLKLKFYTFLASIQAPQTRDTVCIMHAFCVSSLWDCIDMQMQRPRKVRLILMPLNDGCCVWGICIPFVAIDQWCLRRNLEIWWHDFISNKTVGECTSQVFLLDIIYPRRLTLLNRLPTWTLILTLDACWLLLFRMSGDAPLVDYNNHGSQTSWVTSHRWTSSSVRSLIEQAID